MDTTTPRGSVALVEDDEVLGEVRLLSEAGHSARLLPAVAFLLEELGLAAADVDGYAVATGPGSFTGLRVGISTVQGLALGAGKPCLGVPGLDVLAARIRGTASCLAAMMDAFRGEVYGGLYDAEARIQGERLVESPEAFIGRAPEVAAFIGDGVRKYGSEILRLRPHALFPVRGLFLAGTLGRLAAARIVAGEGVSPEALRPLYLRPVDIRRAGT